MPSRQFSAIALGVALVAGLWPARFTALGASTATTKQPATLGAPASLPPRLPALRESADITWAQVPKLDELQLKSLAAIVVELPSGRIVGAQDADVTLPLASLTKLMTAVVALGQHPALDKLVVLTPSDSSGLIAKYQHAGDSISSLGVPAGESMTMRDLLAASLIASANNAAAAVARVSGLTRQGFVQRMNQRAATLGLSSATFTDPTGLDTANQGSAFDVAILARYAWQNTTLRQLSASPTYDFTTVQGHAYHLKHTNPLARGKQGVRVVASKTGYLNEAGYNLAMVVRTRRQREYLMVLLKAPTAAERTQDARTIAHWLESNS